MNLALWKDTNVCECLSGGCSLLRTHGRPLAADGERSVNDAAREGALPAGGAPRQGSI